MTLIDTHVHLNFPDFNEDCDEVLNRARSSGIKNFINIGADIVTSRESIELAQKFHDIYATVGLHPHEAKTLASDTMKEFERLAANPRVVAIGEVGLDFFRNLSGQDVQKEVFRSFIQLHQKTNKPLVIHCRDAYEDLMDLLREQLKPPFTAVSHCFSSERKVMMQMLDLGFYIAFGGALTYKNNHALREALKACPSDRLLLETDAPYMPPQSWRGKRNEPAYLVETAELACALRGVSLEDLGEQTSANAREVFRL